MAEMTEADSWHNDQPPKRIRRAGYRGGYVVCEECSTILDYEYGSIAWSCVERDLCASCWGAEAARRAAKVFRNALRIHPATPTSLETDDG